MRFLGIIAFAAAAALEAYALSTVVGNPPSDIADLFGSAIGVGALGLHALATAIFAFGGVLLSRQSPGGALGMFGFLFVFAATLPVVGLAAGIIMILLLNLPVHTDPFEEHFATGNPLLDRASNRGVPEVPAFDGAPLTATMRLLDREQVPRLILGLKHFLPSHGARALLQRFQRDPSSQVQFYAQSALGDESGRLEDYLAILGTRTEVHPEKTSLRSSIAEILLHLAAMPGTVATDREALTRQALEHLLALPESPSVLAAITRAHLLLGDPGAARAALEKGESLGTAPALADDFRRQILFLEGAWQNLADDSGRPLSASHRAALKFWHTSAA